MQCFAFFEHYSGFSDSNGTFTSCNAQWTQLLLDRSGYSTYGFITPPIDKIIAMKNARAYDPAQLIWVEIGWIGCAI
jgi:hypothetical protein